MDGIDHLCDFLEAKSLLEEEMYNYNIPDVKQLTYILAPIRLLTSDETKYIQVTLDLYPNGFAMIKTYEINSNLNELYRDLDEIENSQQSLQILNSFGKYPNDKNTYNDTSEDTLTDVIVNCYIGNLFNNLNLEYTLDVHAEVTLLLKDSQEKLDLKEKEELFRIVNRPIHPSLKINSEQIETLYINNFEIGNSKVWSSSKGHIVVISNEIIQDGEKLDDYNKFISIEPAVDFPLKINILSKLNNIYLLWKSSQKNTIIENIREIFLKNRIFISDLSENFYGSARDLELFFKNNMIWYLNEAEFKNRNKDLQMIIDNQKIKTEKKTSKYIEVVTLLFTTMFGLPAIKEILETIVIVFYPDSPIDYVMISKVSLLVLFILILSGFLFVIRNHLKKLISSIIIRIKVKYYKSKTIKFR